MHAPSQDRQRKAWKQDAQKGPGRSKKAADVHVVVKILEGLKPSVAARCHKLRLVCQALRFVGQASCHSTRGDGRVLE